MVAYSTIEGLRRGDHDAFDLVFSKYYKKTLGFVHALIKNQEDAEDIVGDVFVALWTHREKIDPGRNFNAYVYAMARNAVMNYFRSEKIRNSYLNASAPEHESRSSDELFIAKETELLIRLTVNQMPQQRKNIFTLSRDEGLSNDEIAQQLGISKKAVEKQLRLALSDIRKVLAIFVAFLMQ